MAKKENAIANLHLLGAMMSLIGLFSLPYAKSTSAKEISMAIFLIGLILFFGAMLVLGLRKK